MINISGTFLREFANISQGMPEGINTNLIIPYITKAGKKITTAYKVKAFLPNRMFPVE